MFFAKKFRNFFKYFCTLHPPLYVVGRHIISPNSEIYTWFSAKSGLISVFNMYFYDEMWYYFIKIL